MLQIMLSLGTTEDQEMSELRSFIHAGLTEDGRKVLKSVQPYLQYRSSLYELGDGVIMLGDKIIIPKKLRDAVLHLLHAAHQGIDRMKGRASRCVFWPGIVSDICRIRESCAACHKMAKSNPSLPPYPPPVPQYPFQYLSADYFNFKGKEYCVVVEQVLSLASCFCFKRWSQKLYKMSMGNVFYI